MADAIETLTRKDFVSDQEVRWCPGCGDYAILAQMQRVLPEMGIAREEMVFISGIGCSSRFPYYMNTYGLHTIHGRAATVATGLKVANPDLHVWVITGDGDSLSIGGNHLLHVLRRNVDLNIILFNNAIYGLTKGQYSPTSPPGTRTYSSPMGSVEQDFNAISVALAAEATFVARSVDRNTKHMARDSQTRHRTPRHVLCRNLSELQYLQRRCLVFCHPGRCQRRSDRDSGTRPTHHFWQRPRQRHPHQRTCARSRNPGQWRVGKRLARTRRDPGQSSPCVFAQPSHTSGLSGAIRRISLCRTSNLRRANHRTGPPGGEERGAGDLNALYHATDTWIVPEGPDAETVQEVHEELPTSNIIPDIDHEDPMAPRTALQQLLYDPISSLDLPAPECVSADTSVADAVETMRSKNMGCLLVVDKQGLCAAYSHRAISLKKLPDAI